MKGFSDEGETDLFIPFIPAMLYFLAHCHISSGYMHAHVFAVIYVCVCVCVCVCVFAHAH